MCVCAGINPNQKYIECALALQLDTCKYYKSGSISICHVNTKSELAEIQSKANPRGGFEPV